MFLLWNIILLLCGIAGAAGMLKERFPQWQEKILQIDGFKGILGFVLFILGIARLIDWLWYGFSDFNLPSLPLIMLMIILGIIQGIGIIKQLTKKENTLIAWLIKIRSKTARFEEVFGIIAIIWAVVNIIRFIF